MVAVPAPLGVAEYQRPGAETVLLALVQPYLHNGTEGWALALSSLRDLYAEAEEQGVGGDETALRHVEEQGATFLPESARLGEVTAEMHLALASDAMPESMRARPVTAAMLGAWADAMTRELDQLLSGTDPALEPPLLALVVSGAHSDLVWMAGHGDFEVLGRTRLPAMAVFPDKDKVTRARTLAARYEAGKVFHLHGAPGLDDYEMEAVGFPNGEHDDLVDAAVYGADLNAAVSEFYWTKGNR